MFFLDLVTKIFGKTFTVASLSVLVTAGFCCGFKVSPRACRSWPLVAEVKVGGATSQPPALEAFPCCLGSSVFVFGVPYSSTVIAPTRRPGAQAHTQARLRPAGRSGPRPAEMRLSFAASRESLFPASLPGPRSYRPRLKQGQGGDTGGVALFREHRFHCKICEEQKCGQNCLL